MARVGRWGLSVCLSVRLTLSSGFERSGGSWVAANKRDLARVLLDAFRAIATKQRTCCRYDHHHP